MNEFITNEDYYHRKDTSTHQSTTPAAKPGKEGNNQRSANSRAQSRSGIDNSCTTGTFIFRQPYRLELAAGRINRRFRCPEQSPDCHKSRTTAQKAGNNLKYTPQNPWSQNSLARPQTVRNPAGRNLHQRIAPEKGTENDPYQSRTKMKICFNGRHTNRNNGTVDIVYRT